MKLKLLLSVLILFSSSLIFSQTGYLPAETEIDIIIETALDYFSIGEYQKALIELNKILEKDQDNKRAAELYKSINELYIIEELSGNDEYSEVSERPEFNNNSDDKEDVSAEDNESEIEELEKPNFSVHEDDENLLLPRDGRSILGLTISPDLVFPSAMGEASVVFPESTEYSLGLNVEFEYFLKKTGRKLGFLTNYSLLLFDINKDSFLSNQLHILDGMLSFRTFFNEIYDSRIIFQVAFGYRGYFPLGYSFSNFDKEVLNGFNFSISLELPVLYIIWEKELLKNIILDLDMSLLFFPEINTLNLFDFKVNLEYRFDKITTGLQFGANTRITKDNIKYMWNGGIIFRFHL